MSGTICCGAQAGSCFCNFRIKETKKFRKLGVCICGCGAGIYEEEKEEKDEDAKDN